MDNAQVAPTGLVFISARSTDYPYAEQVYRLLVSAGVPTFFSQVSLPELGSSDYRKQIDRTLDEAEHMIVITSSVENVLSSWVEAEWGFFVNEKRSARKKGNLVTMVVGGLKPSSLPPSLRYYEVIPYDPEALDKVLRYVKRTDQATQLRGAESTADTRAEPASDFREIATFGEPPGLRVIEICGRFLAAGGLDGAVRLWDLETRSRRFMLASDIYRRARHEGLVTALAFSPDGSHLASGHIDGAVHVWDMKDKRELGIILKHKASVGGIAFSPDGSTLVTGGKDKDLIFWEVATIGSGQTRLAVHRKPAPVLSLTYARDGRWLLTSLADAQASRYLLQVEEVSQSRPVIATLRLTHPLLVLAVSPDGRLLAGGTQNGDVQVFDLAWLAGELSEGRNPKNLHALKILLGHQKPVSSIAFFPTGKQIVTAAAEHNAIVWDVASGETIATLRGGPGESYVSVAVLEAGYRIAGGLTNGRIRLWEAI
jgi:hypothetical protein